MSDQRHTSSIVEDARRRVESQRIHLIAPASNLTAFTLCCDLPVATLDRGPDSFTTSEYRSDCPYQPEGDES